jgi:hypothetical protein
LTLLMSDSLNATVIVSWWALTISVKFVLDEEELDEEDEPPRLPELVPDEDEPEEPDDDVPVEEVDDDDPDDTASPGERLSSETIVPLVGARRRVAASEIWALRTLALSL